MRTAAPLPSPLVGEGQGGGRAAASGGSAPLQPPLVPWGGSFVRPEGDPLPGRGDRRVLLEAADPSLARRSARLLRRAGFQVTVCAGDGLDGAGCPLLRGASCPLVEAAAVVVHALPGPRGPEILGALATSERALLALTGPSAAPVASDRNSLPARRVRGQLVESVRRVYASRARLLQVPLLLRDGRTVRIRAIRPADADALRAFDGGLSEVSRRRRYLGWMSPMTPEWAAKMATTDFRDRFALVAVAGEGEEAEIVGDCRLAPYPEHERSAELAVAVADAYQGVGLGRILVELALGIAADRGLREVVADVRFDNTPIMRLLRSLGFQRIVWEHGIVTFIFRPADPAAPPPASEARRSAAPRSS